MNPGCRVRDQLNTSEPTAPYIIGRELNLGKLPGRQWESCLQPYEQLRPKTIKTSASTESATTARQPRQAQKAIFSQHLWQPSTYRDRAMFEMITIVYIQFEIVNKNISGDSQVHILQPDEHSIIRNKSTTVATIIDEGLIDVFLLNKTWNTTSDDTTLHCCILRGY